MKFGANAWTRPRVLVPTINSEGIWEMPSSTPATERSGAMKSSSTGRQGETPLDTQARYSFCPSFSASL